MADRSILIREIEGLPDSMIEQLLGIVRYIKIGMEHEYVPASDNPFFNSEEFKGIVSEAISEYRHGKTEEMSL
ncbi:MAG: hypothetical protein U5R49_07005 [Deltaproteobacteria bacterium]|nr:hypothetical protein [Deltaproteobacteria bacterium]